MSVLNMQLVESLVRQFVERFRPFDELSLDAPVALVAFGRPARVAEPSMVVNTGCRTAWSSIGAFLESMTPRSVREVVWPEWEGPLLALVLVQRQTPHMLEVWAWTSLGMAGGTVLASGHPEVPAFCYLAPRQTPAAGDIRLALLDVAARVLQAEEL